METEYKNGDYTKHAQRFELPMTLTMSEVHVGHPNLGTQLEPIFIDKENQQYQSPNHRLLRTIKKGRIISKDLAEVSDLQSRWSWSLGILMAWPIFPILMATAFVK